MRASLQYTLAAISLAATATLVAGGAIYRIEDIKTKTVAARAAELAKATALDAEMHRREHLAATENRNANEALRRQLDEEKTRAEQNTPAARELRRLENEDRAALGLPAK
jgi:hypothetical protein